MDELIQMQHLRTRWIRVNSIHNSLKSLGDKNNKEIGGHDDELFK